MGSQRYSFILSTEDHIFLKIRFSPNNYSSQVLVTDHPTLLTRTQSWAGFRNNSHPLHACMLTHFNRAWLCLNLWTVAYQALLFMGFSRQQHLSVLPCPPPRDLPDPGIESKSLRFPVLAGRFFTTSATWESCYPLQLSPNPHPFCSFIKLFSITQHEDAIKSRWEPWYQFQDLF